MKPLILGTNDTLSILAFKWRNMKKTSQRLWLFVIFAIAGGLLLGTSYIGKALRAAMAIPSGEEGAQTQETLTIWLNIFLSENASMATGGIIWAMLGSIFLIPLVGYSFSSIIPEGDLASIKVTDNHKISDSIFLQFVSTISFVQIIVLTAIASIITIDSKNPGIGIVFIWGIWGISVLATVAAAWFFELLYRKYGLKAKLISFGIISITVGIIFLLYPDDFIGFFGIGAQFTEYVQGLSADNLSGILVSIVALIIASIFLLALISFIASNTLKINERAKKKNNGAVLTAKLGLTEKLRINTLTKFMSIMIFRQNNLWKPMGLAILFSLGMSLVFYSFYNILIVVAALLPIMLTLAWTINLFGILGAGTTWIVSLPNGKEDILKSVFKIQFVFVILTSILISLIMLIAHEEVTLWQLLEYIISTIAVTAIITVTALKKSVYSPYRYRVHIRGESILPPNKAFAYMAQLFFIGFLITIMINSLSGLSSYILNEWAGLGVQVGITAIVCLIAYASFRKLKNEWLSQPEIMQNVVKTVGQQ